MKKVISIVLLTSQMIASSTFECNQVVNSSVFTPSSQIIDQKSIIIIDDKGMVTIQRNQNNDIIMANPIYYYDDTEMVVSNDTYETRVKIKGDNNYFSLKSKSELTLFYIFNELTDSGISFIKCNKK